MNEHEYKQKYTTNCCKPTFDNILTLKVYDECMIKKCIKQGPVISADECTCIIMPHDNEDHLGRIIIPGRPICLPKFVTCIKVINDSIKPEKIKISKLSPSCIKKGCWEAEIIFTFVFKIQLFDINMKKLELLCCPPDCHSIDDCKICRDYILGTVDYVQKAVLSGPDDEFCSFLSSDLFENMNQPILNSPHVLVESAACVIDSKMESPDEACFYNDVLDGTYDEPIIYIFIHIGLLIIIKLFKLVTVSVESKECGNVKPCEELPLDVCELFNSIKFPVDEFAPPDRKPDCKER